MRARNNIGCLLVAALSLMGCSKGSTPQKTENPQSPAASPAPSSTPCSAAPAEQSPAAAPASASGRGVKTEMRNVLFRFTRMAGARLETLSGELWPTGKNEMPVFDDKSSFEVRVTSGKVSITPDALSSIMNSYVFAKADAPLKDLAVTIKNGQLDITGKLHSKGDVPFETTGTLGVTSDGRLRVHTEKVKALHVPVKGMMGLLGIELANVLNTDKIDGIDTDKNDLLMDLGRLLPPPHIRGKVTSVQVTQTAIVTIFGDGGKDAPASEEKGNYMQFEGNRVRFGKITMENTDLTILDLDPSDPLDWSQDSYKEQLVQGYAKIKDNFGLRAYVKDYAKLSRSSSSQASSVPKG